MICIYFAIAFYVYKSAVESADYLKVHVIIGITIRNT